MAGKPPKELSQAEYDELEDFRYQIRRFLHFSENAALAEGIEPRQHQALLVIKALAIEASRPDGACTIGALAGRLFLQHQSAVGLVDRLERRELVARAPQCTYAPLDQVASSAGHLNLDSGDGRYHLEGDGFQFVFESTNSSLIISNNVHTSLATGMLNL